MAQTPFPVGFKQPRAGFGSSYNPKDFLSIYLQGMMNQGKGEDTSTQAAPSTDTTPSTSTTPSTGVTPAGQQQPGSVIGDLGDIGYGKTAEGKTILDPYGSYAGFMPAIEKRDGKFYTQDYRGYGPFAGKMHEVPESMARMQARKASMGMTRYLMPNPNPEQFAYKTTIDGISGTMSPSYVTGGGTIWNPRFTPDQPGAPDPTRPAYAARQRTAARRAAIRG